MEVYLDNSATTRVRPEVLQQIIDVNENYYGNPSSLHRMGLIVEKKVDEARRYAAKIINAKHDEIYFTGGGTESNNIALFSHLSGIGENANIITTKIEHPSVYNVVEQFKDRVSIRYVETDGMGRVNIDNLSEIVDSDTVLVSIMHVNNEIGIVQDIKKIAEIVKSKNKHTKIHVDAVQSYGKIKIDVNSIPVDTMAFSSHKIHGPKGVGGLFIRSSLKIKTSIFGGGQERGIRPGTENTPGIIGFGEACRLLYEDFEEERNKLNELKLLYAKRLTDEISDIRINSLLNGEGAPHILNVSFKNVRGEVLVHFLEQKGIYVSTGSACSSKSKNNRILEAVNIDKEYIEGSIRMSLGFFNNPDEAEYVVTNIKQAVKEIREIMML
ncbi:cysteine desulfurase family protein [Sedimentibacter sp.]|uniref:cysteine desulfurase family protein n=1 Tax=Sedimentibacter sp. TaxID=1960295 RepID=UPI00289C4FAF|nr:cysteine desulfurase family protein [Sedimentibacter sp.]